jgi:hypothetical protein
MFASAVLFFFRLKNWPRDSVFAACFHFRPERSDMKQAAGGGIWQRTEHDAIEHGEDRGRGAESERERQQRDDRECRRATKGVKRVARLAPDRVEKLHAISPVEHSVVDRACFRAIGLVVAETPARFALGVRAREAVAFHEVLDASLEMEAELVVQLVANAEARRRKPEHSPEAVPAVVGARHRDAPGPPCFAPTMRPTTLV